ncbi:hypothetical protein VTL71DRAFT_8674 [Oculimacula yallundae]|uniref:Uncharacterized protein n=1 Tax=Oculimacula yallundae TaxID=86028 RepID=A0ABR4CYA9_9HELO
MNSLRGLKENIKKPFRRGRLNKTADEEEAIDKAKEGTTFIDNSTHPVPVGFGLANTDGTNDGRSAELTPPQSHLSRHSITRNWSINEYAMAPSEDMAKRVAQHHTLIRKITGFLIHPKIQKALPKGAKIADLNTGTGKFLLELAGNEGKHYELAGFDTMPQIFPGAPGGLYERAPPNVKFEKHSILTRHPAHRWYYFDSVHTSFQCPVLVADQWSVAFNYMIELAKPGSWIQWVDANLSSQDNKDRIYISKAESSKACHQEMMAGIAQLDEYYGNSTSGGKRLASIARAHPWVRSTTEEVYNTAQLNEVRKEIDILVVQAWKRLLIHLVDVPGCGWDLARVDRVVKGMEAEVKNGVYIPLEVYVVVAQKKYNEELVPDDLRSIQSTEELQLGAHTTSANPSKEFQKQGPSRGYQEALKDIAAAERGPLANDPRLSRQDARELGSNGQIPNQESSKNSTETDDQRIVRLNEELQDLEARRNGTRSRLEKTKQIRREYPETNNQYRVQFLTGQMADLDREKVLKVSELRTLLNVLNGIPAGTQKLYYQAPSNTAGNTLIGDQVHSQDAWVGESNDQLRSQEPSGGIPETMGPMRNRLNRMTGESSKMEQMKSQQTAKMGQKDQTPSQGISIDSPATRDKTVIRINAELKKLDLWESGIAREFNEITQMRERFARERGGNNGTHDQVTREEVEKLDRKQSEHAREVRKMDQMRIIYMKELKKQKEMAREEIEREPSQDSGTDPQGASNSSPVQLATAAQILGQDTSELRQNDQNRSQQTNRDFPATVDQTRLQLKKELQALSRQESMLADEAIIFYQKEEELGRKVNELDGARDELVKKLENLEKEDRELPIKKWTQDVHEAFNGAAGETATAPHILGQHNFRHSRMADSIPAESGSQEPIHPMPRSEPGDIDPDLSSPHVVCLLPDSSSSSATTTTSTTTSTSTSPPAPKHTLTTTTTTSLPPPPATTMASCLSSLRRWLASIFTTSPAPAAAAEEETPAPRPRPPHPLMPVDTPGPLTLLDNERTGLLDLGAHNRKLRELTRVRP